MKLTLKEKRARIKSTKRARLFKKQLDDKYDYRTKNRPYGFHGPANSRYQPYLGIAELKITREKGND